MIIKDSGKIPFDPMDIATKTYLQWLISPLDGEEKIGLRRFVIKPGGEIPPHRHKEIYHIQFALKGSYLVGDEKRSYKIRPGTVIYIPPGEIHWYRNESDEEAEFICVIPLDVDTATEVIKEE